MIIRDFYCGPCGEGFELSAEIQFESLPDTCQRVWFRTEPGGRPLRLSADPFFVGFLVPAMALREDLRIEATVTRALIESAGRGVVPFMLRRHRGFRFPEIETEGDATGPVEKGAGVLCSISCGVDSWETFLRHRSEITHVMHCQGFDRVESFTDPRYIRKMQSAARSAAQRHGKVYLGLTSNLTAVGSLGVNRARYKRGLPVDLLFQRHAYFGSELVALAHVHADLIRKYYIASSQTYDRRLDYGSSPITDPAWSIPGLRIVHDGAGLDRTEKLESIAKEDPGALAGLYVCHADLTPGENCHECEKCVRTRAALYLAGLLDRCPTLRSPLDLDEIRRLEIGSDQGLWENLLDSSRRRGNQDLSRAIEIAMGRRFEFRRAGRDFGRLLHRLGTSEGRKRCRRDLRRRWLDRRAEFLADL